MLFRGPLCLARSAIVAAQATIMAAVLCLGLLALETPARAALPACDDAWRAHRVDPAFVIGRDDYAQWKSRTSREACRKEWTILVYMAADNDLSPYAFWDLYEMEAAFAATTDGASQRRSDLVVQLDSAVSDRITRFHMFQGPEKNLSRQLADFGAGKWSERDVRSPVAQSFSEVAGAERGKPDEARLAEFLEWGVRSYPADNVMVVVWGHGQGWAASPPPAHPARSRFIAPARVAMPALRRAGRQAGPTEAGAARRFGGLAFDDSTRTYLGVPALRRALARAGRARGRPIDVYASDACLMQMVEVSTELADVARYVVGASDVQSFLGFPYRRIMQELNRGSYDGQKARVVGAGKADDKAYLMARMLPGLTVSALKATGGGAGRFHQGAFDKESIKYVTTASLNSSELKSQLVPALQQLGAALGDYLDEDAARAADVQFVVQNTPSFEGNAQDLGTFLWLLEMQIHDEAAIAGEKRTPAADRLQAAVIRAQAALSASVVSYSLGATNGVSIGEKRVGGSPKGVSIWLPGVLDEYRARATDFATSRFFKGGSPARPRAWQSWLARLFK